jgi:hypothetical protein
MKKLEVTINISDPDHSPPNGSQTLSIITNAPWLTAGRIIEALSRTVEAEGCRLENNNPLWQEDEK